MCKTQAIKIIRYLGLSVRATGFGSELRITYRLTSPVLATAEDRKDRAEALAYYTDNPQDAIETAKRMAVAVVH